MPLHQSPNGKAALLFAALEKLRALGIGEQIHLPQIVVFGDQSSGKSTVLRRIFGIPLLTDDGLCTRHPTRLYTERVDADDQTPDINITATIETCDGQPKTYPGFPQTTQYPGEVPRIARQAAEAMGLDVTHGSIENPDAQRFSREVLCIRVASPHVPFTFTVIDLPGLFMVGDGEKQTDEDVGFIRALVKDYINRPNTVAIAVMSATQDLVNQACLSFLQAETTGNVEVLAVVTKPDKIEHNQIARDTLIKHINTNAKSLPHGWHILRNFPPDQNAADLEMKQERYTHGILEQEFFDQVIWEGISSDKKGLDALETHLLDIQTGLQEKSFIGIIQACSAAIREIDMELSELGTTTKDYDRGLLFELAAHLHHVLKHPPLETSGPLALNSNLSEIITAFRSRMKTARDKTFTCGEEVVDLESDMNNDVRGILQQQIRGYLIQKNDPPGCVSPEVILRMFHAKCQNWGYEVEITIDAITASIKQYVQALFEIDDKYSGLFPGFDRNILTPSLAQLKDALLPSKALRIGLNDVDDEMVHDLLRGLPVGRARYLGKLVKDEVDRQQQGTGSKPGTNTFDLRSLRKAVEESVSVEAGGSNAAEALTCLCVFYQDRFESLLNDFSKDRVMSCFKRIIVADMFPATIVRTLKSQTIIDICTVDDAVQMKKAALQSRRQGLEAGVRELRTIMDLPDLKHARDETDEAGTARSSKRQKGLISR